MQRPPFDPDWLAALYARSQCPPRESRLPLLAQHQGQWVRIGSVTQSLINQIASLPPSVFNILLQIHEHSVGDKSHPAWRVLGDATTSLNELAQHLRNLSLAGAWRSEQLAVTTEDGTVVGSIERAAVRPFGIATRAVHLLGFTPDGRQWVQQRAHDKPNDPSQWDTLMGGMIPADNTLHEALARETWEEAGLHIEQLLHLRHGGQVSLSKPSADGKGLGYLEERIDWFTATLPDGLEPVNQDGEVAQFACLTWPEIIDGLHRGDYTDEAALMLVEAYRGV